MREECRGADEDAPEVVVTYEQAEGVLVFFDNNIRPAAHDKWWDWTIEGEIDASIGENYIGLPIEGALHHYRYRLEAYWPADLDSRNINAGKMLDTGPAGELMVYSRPEGLAPLQLVEGESECQRVG